MLPWCAIALGLTWASVGPAMAIPSRLLAYRTDPVRVTLGTALYGQQMPSDHVASETFEDISGHKYGNLTQAAMYNYVNKTLHQVSVHIGNRDSNLPSLDAVSAAAFQWLLAESQPDSSVVTRSVFLNRLNDLLSENIVYFEGICREFHLRSQQCEPPLTDQNKDLAMVWRAVEPRISVMQKHCETGLTSLGGYRTESCVIAVPFPLQADQNTTLAACMQLFQCFVAPNESRLNPWNVSIDRNWSQDDSPQPPPTADQFAKKMIIAQYITEFFESTRNGEMIVLLSDLTNVQTGVESIIIFLQVAALFSGPAEAVQPFTLVMMPLLFLGCFLYWNDDTNEDKLDNDIFAEHNLDPILDN